MGFSSSSGCSKRRVCSDVAPMVNVPPSTGIILKLTPFTMIVCGCAVYSVEGGADGSCSTCSACSTCDCRFTNHVPTKRIAATAAATNPYFRYLPPLFVSSNGSSGSIFGLIIGKNEVHQHTQQRCEQCGENKNFHSSFWPQNKHHQTDDTGNDRRHIP